MPFVSRSGFTPRSSMPFASRQSRRPSLPSNFITSISERRCRSPIVRKRDFADAPDQPHRFVGKKGLRLRPPEHGKAPRLIEIRGDLCEKLAIAQSNRHADPDLLLDAACETGERLGGAGAVQANRSSQIDKGF